MLDEIISLRQQLHSQPEVALDESATSKTLINFLRKFQPSNVIHSSYCHGFIASWDFGSDGPSIMLRAELDALPLREQSGLSYRSGKEGIAHLCGHDGHMAILCSIGKVLAEQPYGRGSVHLLFQPAEERGLGADLMLNDHSFREIAPDFVFALHNLPGYPLHEVIWRNATFTLAVIGLDIRINGTESHAAEPEKGKNPALAIAHIVQQTMALNVQLIFDDDYFLATPIQIDMGSEAYGTSAGNGVLRFTIRAMNDAQLERKMKEIESLVGETCRSYSLEYSINWLERFHATSNDPLANELILEAARQLELTTHELSNPNKFGEDFGLFTQKYRGALFGLGAGENHPPLHSSNYDFPDDLLETGVNIFTKILDQVLSD